MKRLIFILLLVAIVAAAGCGTENSENPQSGVEENSQHEKQQEQTKTDSGRFTGRIDNNSIEIKISGVPEEKAARAFQLSEDLKANFENLELKSGDEIKFNYIPKEDSNDLITKIEKINN